MLLTQHAGQFWGKRTTTPRWIALVLAHANTFPFPKKMQAITSLFTVKPVTRRPKVAKRGSLQVVAHGGVGGSGGTQYPGKDKPYGSDQAPWKKKLILHDDDQADPEANQRSGQRWTPPPPKQESFAAAAPAQSTSSWDSPSSGSGGSSNAYSWDSGGSSSSSSAGSAKGRPTHYDPDQYDPDANQRGYMGGGGGGGGGYSAPKPSYGGSTGGGYAAAKPQRVTRGSDGVTYDPDQYDPDANQRSR